MKMNMKRLLKTIPAAALLIASLSGCGSDSDTGVQANAGESSQIAVADTGAQKNDASDSVISASGAIYVVSREDGSGTRGAFIELTGVESKDDDGNKIDNTTQEASIKNSTSAVITTVAENESAIGYISLGSMNDTVKAVSVDGIEASAETVKDGSYKISRPFNIATADGLSTEAQDFIDFILSSEGQAVIAENNYIEVTEGAPSYAGSGVSGKIVVAGSSSVSPVMEKLREAYIALNPDVDVEIQTSDSSAGMSAAIDGLCDIGMASRELKDSELESGLTPTVIAMDGIAVIVNNANAVADLSVDQIQAIFTGAVTAWENI